MFILKFDTDNVAFEDSAFYFEIKRILEDVAQKVIDCERSGSVLDYNGNKIGKWEISE